VPAPDVHRAAVHRAGRVCTDDTGADATVDGVDGDSVPTVRMNIPIIEEFM